MRHTITTTLLLILFTSLAAVAQTIPNADFENWSPSTTTLMWEHPTDWTTTNAMTEFIGAGVRRVVPAQSGDSACQLSTMIIFGDTVPATMVNGTAGLNYPEYQLTYEQSGSPTTTAYHYLHGFYKFSSQQNDDSAMITVVYRNWNASAGKTDTVASISKLLPATSTFTEFQVDLSVVGSNAVDTVLVIIQSGNPNSKRAGGMLVVDNLSMDMINSTGHYPSKVQLNIYPNPASNKVNITTGNNEAIQTVSLIDITGKTVLSRNYNNAAEAELALAELKTGIYFVRVTTNKGIVTQKLTVTK